MLGLESPRWSALNHAYGSAADIPALLVQLQDLPSSSGESEPWFSLWSALAHQGDVYSASFAAVPHVVAALATAPARADESYFQFPAWVEVCRAKQGVPVPPDLFVAYSESLVLLPGLVAQAAVCEWSAGFAACAMSAIAAAKGQNTLAEAVLELSSGTAAEEFLQWQLNR